MPAGRLLGVVAALGILAFSVRGMATQSARFDPKPAHSATLPEHFTLTMNGSIFTCTMTGNAVNCTRHMQRVPGPR
jgi:hypothetical protein